MNLPKPEERVFTSIPYAGFRAMQVCVVPDATDAEILEHCNRDNPQLVSGGWHTVINTQEQVDKEGLKAGGGTCALPGTCVECPPRLHKLVVCM